LKIAGKVVVITGAAGGIGLAIARRCKAEGAKGIVLTDVQAAGLAAAAQEVGGIAVTCDVTRESDVQSLIAQARQAFGRVDMYFSNAGLYRPGGEESTNEDWSLNWNIHVMAHVYAARLLMPEMVARNEGYFVITASAAGLLSHVVSATYATTKHAAVAFGEYLAITYGSRGVRVSVLCPQAVRTAMTQDLTETTSKVDGMLEPEVLADCVVETMDAERFLILPHPTVLEYLRRKTADYDRWLGGMRRLKERSLG
jgi:NAD(P)-dependent dehydrogenase (short-subunit alcohol dehydrogenase family)